MAAINKSTFQGLPVTDNGYTYYKGTVEVTLRGETRRVEALRFTDGAVSASGMFGRYRTSNRKWCARISSNANGAESAQFGRDDRSSRFNKIDALWFGQP